MAMSPPLRKLALTAHVVTSVGWLGAVGAFLALAIAGLTHGDPAVVRASYIAMELTGWFVIVPLAFATFPTGLLLSLGTEWGLFRHYWILAKLVITVVATVLLLVHMEPVGHVARAVAVATLQAGELAGLRVQLLADAGAATAALLVATVLSIYKPRGLTPFGEGTLQSRGVVIPAARTTAGRAPAWIRAAGVLLLLLALLFVLRHLGGSGLPRH